MIKLTKEINFKDKHLIIPSVSIGNVGQLSADLLISSLQMEKIGTVWSKAIIPIVGADPYNTNTDLLSSACELYWLPSGSLVVLQLRSGLYNKYAKEFLTKLSEFIKEQNFKAVIILTSCFAYEQHAIKSSPFRYLANNTLLKMDQEKIDALGWLPLKKTTEKSSEESIAAFTINGGGFALKFHEILSSSNIGSLLIMMYCSEGDNIPDSLATIKFLNAFLNLLEIEQITFPPSWDLLFGGPPPVGIY